MNVLNMPCAACHVRGAATAAAIISAASDENAMFQLVTMFANVQSTAAVSFVVTAAAAIESVGASNHDDEIFPRVTAKVV